MAVYSLKEINQAVRTDPKAFVEESDAAFQKKIESAAQKIAGHVHVSRVVLLSGPSGSGKTTTSRMIQAKLEQMGVKAHAVSMDNYFQTVDPETSPRNREGLIDYESPFCLDMNLLNQHFKLLDRGETIYIPKFDFARQMRSGIHSNPLKLGKDEIAIFEGIHALNDIITGKNPNAMKLYISARSSVADEAGSTVFKNTWLRLARRMVRDAKFRSWEPHVTMKMWSSVRRGEKLYISPFKDNADIQFDSSLPYEVSVLKSYVLPFCEQLTPEIERYEEIGQLLEAYPRFETMAEGDVAPDSLIREFIGGGIYGQ